MVILLIQSKSHCEVVYSLALIMSWLISSQPSWSSSYLYFSFVIGYNKPKALYSNIHSMSLFPIWTTKSTSYVITTIINQILWRSVTKFWCPIRDSNISDLAEYTLRTISPLTLTPLNFVRCQYITVWLIMVTISQRAGTMTTRHPVPYKFNKRRRSLLLNEEGEYKDYIDNTFHENSVRREVLTGKLSTCRPVIYKEICE